MVEVKADGVDGEEAPQADQRMQQAQGIGPA
jgi:hypothetical protein